MVKKVRFYFGGLSQVIPRLRKNTGLVVGINQLISFAEFGKSNPSVLKQLREGTFYEKDRVVIFDSGAFSVWNSGHVIDPDQYIQFIKTVQEAFSDSELYFVALDKISPDKSESARYTHANFLYERSCGVKTIPTYHLAEDLDYLNVYTSETDYICFGGMYGKVPNRSLKDQVAEGLFGYTDENLVDKAMNRVAQLNWKGKIHGLAVGYPKALLKYDFYSVDTTTCLIMGTRGRIFLGNDVEPYHVTNLGLTNDVKSVVEKACELLYFDPQWLVTSPYCRVIFNVYQYVAMCNEYGIDIDYGKYFTRKVDASMSV